MLPERPVWSPTSWSIVTSIQESNCMTTFNVYVSECPIPCFFLLSCCSHSGFLLSSLYLTCFHFLWDLPSCLGDSSTLCLDYLDLTSRASNPPKDFPNPFLLEGTGGTYFWINITRFFTTRPINSHFLLIFPSWFFLLEILEDFCSSGVSPKILLLSRRPCLEALIDILFSSRIG